MTNPIATDTRRVAPTPPETILKKDVSVKPAVDSLASLEAAKAAEESSYLACICTFVLAAITTLGGLICHYLSSWFGSEKAEEKPELKIANQLSSIYANVEQTWLQWEKPDDFACRVVVSAKFFMKKDPEGKQPAPKIYKAAKYFNQQNLNDFQKIKGFFQKMQGYASKSADLADFQLAVAWGYQSGEEPHCTLTEYTCGHKDNKPAMASGLFKGYPEIATGISQASALQGIIGIKNLFDEEGNLIHEALTGRAITNKERQLPLDRIVANQIFVSFTEFFKGYEELNRVFPCRCLAFLQIVTNESTQDLKSFKFGKLCKNKIDVTEGLGLFQQILPLKSPHLVDFKLDFLLIHANKTHSNKFDYTTVSFELANSAASNSEDPTTTPYQSIEPRSSEELMKELHEHCPAFDACGEQADILSSTGHLNDRVFSTEI